MRPRRHCSGSRRRSQGSFECKLDAGDWDTCDSPKSYTGLLDGEHTFSVRATDAVGNADATPATRTWTVDTGAPDTSITSGPSGTVATAAASFAFSATESGSFECKLDAGDWEACASPKSYSGLGEGAHSLSVRATDAVGNVDPTPASRTWTVDTVAPDTSITTGPSGTVASSAASFEFSATEPGALECKLDGDAWGSCASPMTYSSLPEGEHSFAVRATDPAGNTDGTPAMRAWTVDMPVADSGPPSGPPADRSEDLDGEEPPADDNDDWAAAYLSGVLQDAVRANRRRRLRAIVRRRALRLEIPGADAGSLRIKLSLLPSPPGPAIRLAGANADPSAGARTLELRLGKQARRKLRRLWVAAFELSASLTLADGAVVHDRRVLIVRR